jgi:N-acetyl-gamma-glutamyl-phosphate reductase
VAVVAAHSQAGAPIGDLFPNLAGARVFDAVDVDQLAGLDVVVLATPHGPAIELGAALAAAAVPTVDLSAAFRLSADGFATWYGEEHPRPDLAAADAGPAPQPGGAVYGLPELGHRDAFRGATLVANPGCYPTAAILALVPLARAGMLGDVVIDAKSGVSGAGREPTHAKHFVSVDETVTPYKVGRHRHTPEIEQELGDGVRVTFTPHLVPVAHGELVSCYVTPGNVAEGERDEGASRLAGETDLDESHRSAAVREVEEEAGLRLRDPAALVKFSRWITPPQMAIRFDTHFFVARAPAGQEAQVDGTEMVDLAWHTPAGALAAHRRGELQLVFPTIKHLEQLAGFASATELLDWATGREVMAVEPHVRFTGETARVVLPGEPGY